MTNNSNNASNKENGKVEQKIAARNEPVIDGIGSTTYYNSKKNSGEKYFMLGTLAIAGLFILFLPNIYNFVHKLNLSELFGQDSHAPVDGEKDPVVGGEDKDKPEEEKYVAVVCTKATSDDVVTAHTLYFSNSKLKKMSLAETYTLGQNYNSSELETYYNEKKNRYNKYDKIDIVTTVDDNIYSATASIDLYEAPSVVNEMFTINLEYDSKQNDVIDAYEDADFDCE